MASLADFEDFIYSIVGVPMSALPANSPTIPFSYNFALATVLLQLPADVYPVAVNNLGFHFLVTFAKDQTGQSYFSDLQSQYGLDSFTPGVISSTADQSTSNSLLNPDFMRNLTMGDLQQAKTPWGRMYLSIAQNFGPLWAMA